MKIGVNWKRILRAYLRIAIPLYLVAALVPVATYFLLGFVDWQFQLAKLVFWGAIALLPILALAIADFLTAMVSVYRVRPERGAAGFASRPLADIRDGYLEDARR